MATEAKTILEWSYEPKSFFEEPCKIGLENGEIFISEGHVRGEFASICYDQGQEFRDKVHAHVSAVFMAQQVQVHQDFCLSQASLAREHADGRRDVTLFANSIESTSCVGRPDIIVRNANGEIIRDTKTERIAKQEAFRNSVASLTQDDLALKRMLLSFRTALADPDNFFIHLYEIREALVSEYGGDAAKMIGLSSKDWSRFGRLANNEPFQEGRHRGKHQGLQPASKSETEWALSFAERLIEAYVATKTNGPATEC